MVSPSTMGHLTKLPIAILVLALLGHVELHASQAPQRQQHPHPPNILVIVADDLGYGDLGCYGQTRIATPRLDQLASEGIRFTQAYSGATVCAPSRCVLMTGRHTGHCTVRGNAGRKNLEIQSLHPNEATIASVLKRAGYHTALIGKWGLGDVGTSTPALPMRHGFDHFFGYLNQTHAHNYYPEFLWRNETGVQLRNVVPKADETGAGVATKRLDYAPDLFVDEALNFVREHAKDPFFLMFTTTHPHANNEAGKKGMEVPDLGTYRDLDWPEAQKGHAAMITRMDRDVGKILDLLKELNIERNTMVLFVSDNGPHQEGGNDPTFNRSSGPFRGIKRSHYEGGIRIPAILRWPDQAPKGMTSDAAWYFADLFPTLTAIGRGQISKEERSKLDGLDIRPAFVGKKMPKLKRRPMYWEFHEGLFSQAIRLGDWKAIRKGYGAPVELYHLQNDPGEIHDVALVYPGKVRELEQLMKREHVDSPSWPVQRAAPQR